MTRVTRDEEWLLSHMADPVALAPGVRSAQEPAPRPMMSRYKAQAVCRTLRREQAGRAHPVIDDGRRVTALTYAETCVACHRIAGNGGSMGPNLSHVARGGMLPPSGRSSKTRRRYTARQRCRPSRVA